jgi:Mrp family chromosome partitioning ATPase
MLDDPRSPGVIDDQFRTRTSRADRESSALGPYVSAVQSRPLLFVVIVAVTVLAAAAWSYVRTPRYEATARLLVDAVPRDDPTYLGVLVLRQSTDPTRTMQTAAAVAEGSGAANLTAARLGPAWSARRVSDSVRVEPAGESDILDVTGAAHSPTAAARLANTYASAVIEIRKRRVERSIGGAVESVRGALSRNPGEGAAAELNRRLSTLLTLQEAGDSTFSVVEPAARPPSPEGAPVPLVIALALLAGLALASGTVVVLQLATPRRIGHERELLDTFPLPVVARLGRARAGARNAVDGGSDGDLRACFERAIPSGSATAVIEARTQEGATETLVKLGGALAAAGRSVIALDLDAVTPGLGRALGVTGGPDLAEALEGRRLRDVLTEAPRVAGLRVGSVAKGQAESGLPAILPRLSELLGKAKDEADHVLVATPPLSSVPDAEAVAAAADHVLVAVTLRRSTEDGLEALRDSLTRNGRRPDGYVILGPGD